MENLAELQRVCMAIMIQASQKEEGATTIESISQKKGL